MESRPDYTKKELQEEEEITFEQFSGEIYRNVENPNSQSMSVVLGFNDKKKLVIK